MITALENHLWQSTLFCCVVAVLTLMLRRNRAAVRHGLWLAASVKFLVPFALLVSIGSQVEWRKPPAVMRPQLSVAEQISQPFATPAPAQLLVSVPTAPSRLPAILFGVWLCGFAAQGLAWWRRWRHVRSALRMASPLAAGFADTSDVHTVALGARDMRDLPAGPYPAGGYRRTTHNGSIRVSP